MKTKNINNRKMWAYFAPDGYLQVRSIADTKKLSMEMISKYEVFTYKDYEKKGYYIKKIMVNINVIE